MTFTIDDIISFVCLFQLMVFVAFLFQKRGGRTSNLMLAIFLLTQVGMYLNGMVYRYWGFFYVNFVHVFYLFEGLVFLAAPAFYLYVKSVAFSDFRLTPKDLLHLLPFVVMRLYLVFAFHMYSADTKRILLAYNPLMTEQLWMIVLAAMFLSLFIYNVASLRIIREYRAAIREEYSSIQSINLEWLNLLLYAFLVAWLTSVVVYIARFFTPIDPHPFFLANSIAFFIFFNIIFYKALIQPELFSGVEEKPKYQSSTLTTAEADQFAAALQSHMEQNKPYLNPTISLRDLAGQLKIPPRHLSQIINDRLHQNFYDFISRYRVEEAKRIFSDPSKDKTVLEVLFEVGFNSKSSFNTAFKKFTNMTPSKFKENG